MLHFTVSMICLMVLEHFDNLCGIWQDRMFSNKIRLGYQRMTTLFDDNWFERRHRLLMVIIGALKCLNRLHGCEFSQKDFAIDDIFVKPTLSVSIFHQVYTPMKYNMYVHIGKH